MINKLEKTLVVGTLSFMLLFAIGAVIQPAKAQFVIASWDYPDEYGQGIESVSTYKNETGSWQPWHYDEYDYASQSYEWNVSWSIKFFVVAWLNNTLVGADDIDDGFNYFQHSIIVTSLGETVFSQQNFTVQAFNAGDDPMWMYNFYVIMNFIPIEGNVYTVVINYEIYY